MRNTVGLSTIATFLSIFLWHEFDHFKLHTCSVAMLIVRKFAQWLQVYCKNDIMLWTEILEEKKEDLT